MGCQSGHGCHSKHFQCVYTQKCILREWLCDGEIDCGPDDRSDEDPSQCPNKKPCAPNQSKCAGGDCIDTAKFCDGRFDCLNDEYVEFCGEAHTFAAHPTLYLTFEFPIPQVTKRCWSSARS